MDPEASGIARWPQAMVARCAVAWSGPLRRNAALQRRKRGGRWLTALAFWMLAPAVGTAASERPPNILWIMLDDLRPDALGCYGTAWARTPNIDRVAARGVLFKHAYAQNIVCRSSRHSMLTGQYCHTVKDMEMGPKPEHPVPYYRPDGPSAVIDLPGVLAQLGMSPWNVGKTHWSEWWQQVPYEATPAAEWLLFDPPEKRVYQLVKLTSPQTFPPDELKKQRVWTIGGGNPLPYEMTRSGAITDAALAKLEELTSSDQPFFLRVSYFDPHVPIMVPPDFIVHPDSVDLARPSRAELNSKPFFERLQLAQYASVQHLSLFDLLLARGSYYGLVSFVDHQIGRILDFLEASGDLENTLIVFNSDQGMQLGEHGLYKKRNFYEQTVSVPMIFSLPGRLPAGRVVDDLVELVDFLPTVMDLTGVEIPQGIAGRSLVPLIRGEVDRWRPAAFCEIDHSMSGYTALRVHSGRRVMVRTEEWKMIYFRDARVADEDGALYSMVEDPGETRNLFTDPELSEVRETLRRRVDAWDAGARFDPR